jgi:hypothetical protein
MSDELPIPSAVADDPLAREILRLWDMGDDRREFVLNPGLWGDPTNWGVMLVDLARHLARGYDQMGLMDEASALRRIKQLFDLEMNSSTNTGGIIGRLLPRGRR